MLSILNKEKAVPWKQLSLFSHRPRSIGTKARVTQQIPALSSGKIIFHNERSEINENSFSLKITYMGRSYSLKWVYRKDRIRSFQEDDYSEMTIRIIRFDSILAFRDGKYVSAFIPKKEYDELTKNTQNILSNSYYNTTIH